MHKSISRWADSCKRLKKNENLNLIKEVSSKKSKMGKEDLFTLQTVESANNTLSVVKIPKSEFPNPANRAARANWSTWDC